MIPCEGRVFRVRDHAVLLLMVCSRLGWLWEEDGACVFSETWSWHLFLLLGAERSHLPNLKGRGNIWNRLESGDQTAPSPPLCVPSSAALLTLPRAPPKEFYAVCWASRCPRTVHSPPHGPWPSSQVVIVAPPLRSLWRLVLHLMNLASILSKHSINYR